MEHDIQVMRHCVDAYLSHIRYIEEDIAHINEQIDEVYHAAAGLTGMAYDRDAVIVSSEGDKIGQALARLEELRGQLADRVTECMDLLDECRLLCAPHHVGRYVLWLSKVKGKKYAEIARIVDYSEDYIYELSVGGIVDLYYAMPERYRRDSIPNAMPN